MKVQVIMDDEMVARLDKVAKLKGLSRSAYCAQAIISDLLFDESQARKWEHYRELGLTMNDKK